MRRLILGIWALASMAMAGDVIPVTGPARAGVDDWDVLNETVLDLGVLAIAQDDPQELRVGDGLTPGGRRVRTGVTNFSDIAIATTNLIMGHWSAEFGAWKVNGDTSALNVTWGDDELWFRFLRDDGSAFLAYNFSRPDDNVFRFIAPSVEGEAPPVLQVSTNLMTGFDDAEAGTWGAFRPDAAHYVIDYTNSVDSYLFFRLFDAAALSSGAYFSVPIHAEAGMVDAEGVAITNWGDITGPLAEAIAQNTGGIATNAAAIAQNSASIAQNAGNIYSNAAALSTLTNALGQRVSKFEAVRIGYVPSSMSVDVWPVPTNCPTTLLEIYINASAFTSTNSTCTIRIPSTWTPDGPMTVRIYGWTTSANTRFSYGIGTTAHVTMSGSTARELEYQWLPESEGWQIRWRAVQNGFNVYSSAGANLSAAKIGALPKSVDDWIAWRKQQSW